MYYSKICGLVYELLHYKHGQASHMMTSLDLPYTFYPYNYPSQALDHHPSVSKNYETYYRSARVQV